jgi:oxygen-independent coproporphyrinogen III oxidase
VLADEDRYADEFLLANERLTEAGFEHYEVSNFARPGLRSRHNFVYWRGDPYAALGPGAHAFFPPVRRWNVRSWPAYRQALLEERLPLEGMETIDEGAGRVERAWLGLRTADGLRVVGSDRARIVERWVHLGLAAMEQGVVRLTPTGWLLLDELASEMAGAAADPEATD